MRLSSLVAAAVLLPGTAGAGPALDATELEFLRLINEYRAENGAPCLSVSPTMNAAADYMSRAMGERDFFSHNEPPCDASGSCTGPDAFDRMADHGHSGWTTAGENIAAGHLNAQAVFSGWKASPGHNENMLNPNFTSTGIARVEVPGSRYGVYWTNTFSNLVDGSHHCDDGLPPEGYGDPADQPGAGGAGGAAGGLAAGDDEGGCSTGAGTSPLGLAALALSLGARRRYRGR